MTDLFKERDGEIRDQIRTIVAASLPEALAEPGLETIRRQIPSIQLEEDIGKDLIKESLDPQVQSFADHNIDPPPAPPPAYWRRRYR